jgi:hypothetical protein
MAVTGIETNIFEVTSSTDVISRTMNLASCRWIGATTAGHTCEVTDSSGNPIFKSEANGANFIDGWVFGKKTVDGIKFVSMQSGLMQFYKSQY